MEPQSDVCSFDTLCYISEQMDKKGSRIALATGHAPDDDQGVQLNWTVLSFPNVQNASSPCCDFSVTVFS